MSKQRFTGVRFLEVVRDKDKTIAFGVYSDSKIGTLHFAGEAKKHPEDTDRPAIGRNLAISRAFKNLSRQMEKREWERIPKPKKVVEEVVEIKKTSRPKKKEK